MIQEDKWAGSWKGKGGNGIPDRGNSLWKQHCGVEQHNGIGNLHSIENGSNEGRRDAKSGGK